MGRLLKQFRQLLRELKRRNVYQVAATYAVVGFVLIQVADLTFVRLGLPSWTVTFVIVLVAIGFPLALVLAWAFERTPDGVRRTPEADDAEVASGSEVTSPEGRRTQSGLALKALVGFGLLGAAAMGGWYLMEGAEENPEIGERTVAVLPFLVSGADQDLDRTMMTLLSTALDGPASLRALPEQRVLAALEASSEAGPAQDRDPALDAAGRVGAEFAVRGQVAQVAEEVLLFSADVYRTTTGERLGRTEVRGSPDRVTALVDSLSRRVLGVLLREGGGELPAVDLARVTTSDDSALSAFLAGEELFRAGDVADAVAAYQAAIREDSAFALAYTRLSNAAGWGGVEGVRDPLLRAYTLSDQLPIRERRLTQAMYLWVQKADPRAAADTLRLLSEAYPDDPGVWYNLGEVLWHGQVPPGWSEAEEALQRAVDLDPGVAPYHHHLVDLAFSWHRDSALAARRIVAHPGREDRKRFFRLSLDLVFGSVEARRDALDQVETLPVPNDWVVWMNLRHPVDGAVEDRVLRILLGREDLKDLVHAPYALVLNDLERGRIDRALSDIEAVDLHPMLASCYLAGSMAVGLPVPDSVVAAYLEPTNLDPDASLRRLKCAGIYLVERGRGDELESLNARILQAPHNDRWPSVELDRSAESAVELLEGYRAWKAGDLETASDKLFGTAPWDWWAGTGAIWRGDFRRDLGELERAEAWYRVAWWHPVAHQRMGRLYEEMDRPEEAAAAYRRFISAWEDADEELQPRVEEARERLQEVSAETGA